MSESAPWTAPEEPAIAPEEPVAGDPAPEGAPALESPESPASPPDAARFTDAHAPQRAGAPGYNADGTLTPG